MVQRIEVITGKERRRRWSDEEKCRLVAETFMPGATVAQVARRHEVAESCLYVWRKQFGGGDGAEQRGTTERPLLIPVLVEGGEAATAVAAPTAEAAAPTPPRAVITLSDGTRLKIGPDSRTAAAVNSLP